MFLVRHIDSLIQIFLGATFTWLAYGGTSRLSPRAVRILRFTGPMLIVTGGLLLMVPKESANWHREFTSDKVASAEFPGAVEATESTDTLGSVSVKRVSLTHNVPGKDISLFFSYSALPDAVRGMTEAQRIESTIAYLASQGSRVMQNEKVAGTPTIYRLTARQDTRKTTTQMALAYVDDKVYRVVASWTDGGDQALTDRFVNSFRISSPPSR